MHQFMMEVRKFGDLAFHACDFAFDDCSTPHLPDEGCSLHGFDACLWRGMGALQSEPRGGGDRRLPMVRSSRLDFCSA